MEDSLEEWHFEFSVSSSQLIPYQMLDDLMSLGTAWAEKRRLGISGYFGPAANRMVDSDRLWHFDVGLSVQQGGRLISRSVAHELFEDLVAWCNHHNFLLSGGFREYDREDHS